MVEVVGLTPLIVVLAAEMVASAAPSPLAIIPTLQFRVSILIVVKDLIVSIMAGTSYSPIVPVLKSQKSCGADVRVVSKEAYFVPRLHPR